MADRTLVKTSDLIEIRSALALFFSPGSIVELRAPKTHKKTQSGYFSDFDKLVQAAAALSGQCPGVYVVLNECKKELLARSANRLTAFCEVTTSDEDIAQRNFLPIDIDPIKPTGISSTDAQHEAALRKAQDCTAFLISLGFPPDSIINGDSGNGGHVIVRINLPNTADSTALIKRCLEALNHKFKDSVVKVDQTPFNAARIWKLPGTLACKGDNTSDRPHRLARILSAPQSLTVAPREALDTLAATLPAETPRVTAPRQAFDLEKWLTEHNIEVQKSEYKGGTRYVLKACPFNPEHKSPDAAVFMGADGIPGFGCFHDSCQDKAWHDFREFYEPGYRTQTRSKPEPQRITEYRLTDAGNAEYFAGLYGTRLRYDHKRRRWLLWSGHRWQPDVDAEVSRMAIKAAQARFASSIAITDLEERGRVARWAIGSESRMRLEACVDLARAFLPIADNGEGWDSDIMLLGVPNGVVNLRTGELRDGRPEDRITMCTGVQFDPKASCPRWLQCLREIFSNESEIIDWVWRMLGYSITGDTSEQCVVLCYGKGANGKGVFVSAIRAAMGDYAFSAPFSTFELYQRASIPNDLAAMEFKRFVTSSETNDGTRLNEQRLKALSGCDPITARFLHAEFTTFMPHLKVWLFVNHKPRVVDDTFGIWRRVRLIPFTRQFTGADDDKRLSEKLRGEARGILAWLVKGCVEWRNRGLEPIPEAIKVATETYRAECDSLGDFISEYCVEHEKAIVKARDLYTGYKAWAEEQGMGQREMLTATAFGRRLRNRYKKEKRGGTVVYYGIGLAGQSGQLQDSCEANDTESTISPIHNTSRVETRKTILNPLFEAKNCPNCPNVEGERAANNGSVEVE